MAAHQAELFTIEQNMAAIKTIPVAESAAATSPATPSQQEPKYISDNKDSKADED